jgi:hypothetical protein
VTSERASIGRALACRSMKSGLVLLRPRSRYHLRPFLLTSPAGFRVCAERPAVKLLPSDIAARRLTGWWVSEVDANSTWR